MTEDLEGLEVEKKTTEIDEGFLWKTNDVPVVPLSSRSQPDVRALVSVGLFSPF